MIENVAKDLGSSALFGVISICLFFVVFTGALIFALVQKKSVCQAMSSFPLEDVDSPSAGVPPGASAADATLQPLNDSTL